MNLLRALIDLLSDGQPFTLHLEIEAEAAFLRPLGGSSRFFGFPGTRPLLSKGTCLHSDVSHACLYALAEPLSSGKAIERLCGNLGDYSRVIGTTRYLRIAGLWPKSGRGGGKAAVMVEPSHLACFMLGLAAHQPKQSVSAARTLGSLPEVDRGAE